MKTLVLVIVLMVGILQAGQFGALDTQSRSCLTLPTEPCDGGAD